MAAHVGRPAPRWSGDGSAIALHAGLPNWADRLLARLTARTRLRARIGLERGERILVVVRDVNDRLLVATLDALYHQDTSAGWENWTRLGWDRIARVDWNDDELHLASTTLRLDGRTHRQHQKLADLAVERVAWTKLLDTRTALSNGTVLRITARRQASTGQVRWAVNFPSSAEHQTTYGRDDPVIAAEVEAILSELRAEVGMSELSRASDHVRG